MRVNGTCLPTLLVLSCLVVTGCGHEGDSNVSVSIVSPPGMIRIAEVSTDYVNILPAEVREKILAGEDFAIIDVRAPAQYKAGHLPGAISMPLPTLPWAMNQLDRQKEVVVYCQVGGTSIRACSILVAGGFSNVKNMVGGISAWLYQLVSENPTTISI